MIASPHDESGGPREREGSERLETLLAEHVRRQSGSDREAFACLQRELRRIARGKMWNERPNHTLQPTALVNEAFLKIFKGSLSPDFWTEPTRALRLIAHAMEQILNDHADAYWAQKRGGRERKQVPLNEQQANPSHGDNSFVQLDSALLIKPEQSEAILGVREALRLLRKVAPRQASILQLQFYGGLTQEEIAASLALSLETVKLDTRKAKAFLRVHLTQKAE